MPLIEWNANYETGITQMDLQHKRLVDIINRLHDAMREGKGNAVITQVLKELVNYTMTHFTAEEKLMEQCKYAGLGVQKQQHEQFVKQIKQYQEQAEKGALSLTLTVSNFLKNWLLNHIQNLDKQYGPAMKSAGIK